MLLATLPVQGMAAMVSALSCMASGEQHASHPHGPNHHADRVSHDSDSGTGKTDSVHFCCNLVSFGIPATAVTIAREEMPIFVPTLFPLVSLFIPEQPRQPPRV
jgi:hypothetical protein